MWARFFRPGGTRGVIAAVVGTVILSVAALRATEEEDFAVRVTGGGTFCTGEEVQVQVLADLNLTGLNESPTRGYSLAICFVPYQLTLIESLPGLGFDPDTGVDADFVQITETSRGVIQAVIVDLTAPRGIEPQNGFRSLSLRYRVEDAADPAPIWPCDRSLNSPPLVITFSTGAQNYSPPAANLQGTEIVSPCGTEERSFHLRTVTNEALKVRCGTGTGSTIIDVLVREDAVSCCSPRFIKGLSVAVELPEDLEVLRFLPGDFSVAKFTHNEGDACQHIEVLYFTGARFGEEMVAFRMEVASRPAFWPDGFAPTQRELPFLNECLPGDPVGVSYIDDRLVPYVDTATVSATITVAPHCPTFRRGDVNTDGAVDVGDPIMALSWLYGGRADPPPCMDAVDANDDGKIDIGDPIFILTNIFANGSDFPPPANVCDPDPTPDNLDCDTFSPCDG